MRISAKQHPSADKRMVGCPRTERAKIAFPSTAIVPACLHPRLFSRSVSSASVWVPRSECVICKQRFAELIKERWRRAECLAPSADRFHLLQIIFRMLVEAAVRARTGLPSTKDHFPLIGRIANSLISPYCFPERKENGSVLLGTQAVSSFCLLHCSAVSPSLQPMSLPQCSFALEYM